MTFSIRRGKLPTDHFTIVPNEYARDSRLSFAARGLLVWLMSHAADYDITEERMIAASCMGRDGIRKMVHELEACEYLRRARAVTPGAGSTVTYILMDPGDGKAVAQDDGKAVARDDQAKQNVSADQPDDGKAVALLSVEDQEKNKKTSSSSRASRSNDRGTRLPEDFEPDEKMRTWYATEKLEQSISGVLEHQKFMNYWLSKPGAAGRKTDWRRTWMNWMLTAAERNGHRPGAAPGTSLMPTSGAPHQYQPSTGDKRVAQAQILFDKYAQMDRENGL